ILGGRCDCGAEVREFEINSPGDIRPCMGDGVRLILSMFRENFGTSEPLDGKAIFLNKVSGEDRTDEIIAHGAVIAVLRFNIVKGRYSLELRQAGAEIFNTCASKNIVTFGSMSGHLKGKFIPGENIKDIVGDFKEGSSLILRKGGKIGTGIAFGDSDALRSMDKAVKIRDLDGVSDRPLSSDSGREEFVRSNLKHLLDMESNAVSDVKSFIRGKKQRITVSFSGGKDSLAAFGIASKAIKDPELLFVNTGLEFPETVEYVHKFTKMSNLVLHEANAGKSFWNNVDTFGPPAKDFRWCCKVCKLGPMTEMISKDFPDGTITIEGNRMLESFARSHIGFVSRNPFVPNQTTLNPIRTWTAADVWGYIWMKGMDYNPLYERDFERIGCYLCASCLASEWQNTGRIHPELYSAWEGHLYDYAKEKGLPKEFVDMGFWRWKVLPPKMLRFAEGLGLRTEPEKASGPSVRMLRGASSCAAGGYSIEAVVSVPRNRGFSAVEDALRAVGNVRYSDEYEIALLKTHNGTAKLFGGGQISIVASDVKDAEMLFERSVKALLRSQMCTSCGICLKKCSRHAITIKDGLHIDPSKCNSCGRCEESCMVVHYYDKIV
ncbi:MAG: phosphoadenosine phosphosulfate reductase family protein, partial [Candidatus Methanomethylophilaceae archaeon]